MQADGISEICNQDRAPRPMAAPVVTKLRRDVTALVQSPSAIFIHNLIPFSNFPPACTSIFIAAHLERTRPLASSVRLRSLPTASTASTSHPSSPSAARARQTTLVHIDDAGGGVNPTEQRRIIPCSQISEPRLRFRPRGRR